MPIPMPMPLPMPRMTASGLVAAALLVLAAQVAPAQDDDAPRNRSGLPGADTLGATTDAFTMTDGRMLYLLACSGCHGEEGQGARGAGVYPALANNAKLGSARYPVNLVIEGNGAMPAFGGWLDDEQVANVVTYIRTRLGNDYPEPVRPETVGEMRAEFADLDEG